MRKQNLENISFFQSLLNHIMKKGKRSRAFSLLIESLYKFPNKEILSKVFKKVRPFLEVRSVRVRRSSYQVPFPTSYRRQLHLSSLWLIETVEKDTRKLSFSQKLADELENILEGKGNTLKKKEAVYQLAKKNRANMHYRWY
jgi:ribosomal protein S7